MQIVDAIEELYNDSLANLALQVLSTLRNRHLDQISEYECDFLKASWSIERKDHELVYTVRIPLADKL